LRESCRGHVLLHLAGLDGSSEHPLLTLVRVVAAAALLKLGQTEAAVADADLALSIAEGCYAPKTQRKAYLRRAQALFKLGKLDQAEADAEKLGEGDAAAETLLEKIAEARATGGTVV
jgi:tetratricopeptide (TPR) repeat protein